MTNPVVCRSSALPPQGSRLHITAQPCTQNPCRMQSTDTAICLLARKWSHFFSRFILLEVRMMKMESSCRKWWIRMRHILLQNRCSCSDQFSHLGSYNSVTIFMLFSFEQCPSRFFSRDWQRQNLLIEYSFGQLYFENNLDTKCPDLFSFCTKLKIWLIQLGTTFRFQFIWYLELAFGVLSDSGWYSWSHLGVFPFFGYLLVLNCLGFPSLLVNKLTSSILGGSCCSWATRQGVGMMGVILRELEASSSEHWKLERDEIILNQLVLFCRSIWLLRLSWAQYALSICPGKAKPVELKACSDAGVDISVGVGVMGTRVQKFMGLAMQKKDQITTEVPCWGYFALFELVLLGNKIDYSERTPLPPMTTAPA